MCVACACECVVPCLCGAHIPCPYLRTALSLCFRLSVTDAICALLLGIPTCLSLAPAGGARARALAVTPTHHLSLPALRVRLQSAANMLHPPTALETVPVSGHYRHIGAMRVVGASSSTLVRLSGATGRASSVQLQLLGVAAVWLWARRPAWDPAGTSATFSRHNPFGPGSRRPRDPERVSCFDPTPSTVYSKPDVGPPPYPPPPRRRRQTERLRHSLRRL